MFLARILLIFLCCVSVSQAQLKNFLTALSQTDSGATVLGSPSGNTNPKSVFFHLATVTDSIMSSLQKYGKQAGNYATLSAAVTAANADTARLVVSERHNITTNTTISGQLAIIAQRGAKFNISSGDTLRINVAFTAGNYQIKEGSGKLIFGRNSIQYVNPYWFGVAGDGTTDDLSAFNEAIESAKNSNIDLIIPSASYSLSDSLLFSGYNNRTIVSYGSFTNGSGTAKLVFKESKDLTFTGSTTTEILKIGDIWYSRIENIDTDSLLVKSENASWGQFWSSFRDIKVSSGALTIDVGTFACNQNTFDNIRSNGLLIKESAANSREAHNNLFINCDFTAGTIKNTTAKNQANQLVSCYIETVPSGERAIGKGSNFNVFGLNADVNNESIQPKFHNWHIGQTDNIARTVDYAPIAYNMFVNGDLRFYPKTGLPNGFTGSGSASSIVTDNTAPNSSKRVIRTSSTAGQTFKGLFAEINGVDSPEHTAFSVVYKGYIKTVEVYKNGSLQHTLNPANSASDTSSWDFIHGMVETSVGDTVQIRIWNITTADASNRENKVAYVSFTPVRVASAFTPTNYGDFRDGGDRTSADRTIGNVDSTDLGFLTDNNNRLHIQSDGLVGIGTTSPTHKLHLIGEQLTQPDATWSSGDTSRVYFGSTGKNVSGVFGGGLNLESEAGSGDPIKLNFGGNTKFLFDFESQLIMDESDSDPGTGDLDNLDSGAIYFKNNKLVIAYNNGGTITYITIPLDGATTTWTHSTSVP